MPNRDQFKSNEEYNEYHRNYRSKNRDKIRAYNRKYNKAWRDANGYDSEKRYKKRNPKKMQAQGILQRAVYVGFIKKENCKICGSKVSQAHHPDYTKPLEVIWLCPIHHSQIHHSNSLNSVDK